MVISMQGTAYAALVQPRLFRQRMTYDLRRTFLIASIMLKRSPASKIYCAPIAPPLSCFRDLWQDSPAGRCCLYREMEQYGLPVRGVVLFAPSIPLPLVADCI